VLLETVAITIPEEPPSTIAILRCIDLFLLALSGLRHRK
jgi:hypothetical protein